VPPSESIATPRSILPIPSKTAAATNIIDIRLHHGVHYATRSSHVSIATTSTSAQTVTEGKQKITPAIKGITQAVMKELQHADHEVIEICMTRTANEDSLGIYRLGDRRREKQKRDVPKGQDLTKKPPTLSEKRRKS